jgi:hypothetical protein
LGKILDAGKLSAKKNATKLLRTRAPRRFRQTAWYFLGNVVYCKQVFSEEFHPLFPHTMNRRHFLQTSFLLAGTSLAMDGLRAQEETIDPKSFIANGGEGPQKHLTCYPDIQNGRHQLHQLWVLQDNTTLLSYRAHPSQKYPYFAPMAGPVSGLPLVTETGRPWPHHRGVFFGLDKVSGGSVTNGQFWQSTLPEGQIISQGPSFAKDGNQYKVSATTVEIVDRCLWKQGEKEPIIEDQRRFVIKVLDDKQYILDADIVVKALTDIKVEQTNHGLFGVRSTHDLSPDGGGTLESSEGAKGQAATLGKPARWMALYGKRAKNPAVVEGIAVFCPSKAPHPVFRDCPWFTRDYGNISPMPMLWLRERGDNPFTLAQGEELKLRYRVVAFGGTPKDAGLDALWEEFDRAG